MSGLHRSKLVAVRLLHARHSDWSVDMRLGTVQHKPYGVSASIHYDAPFYSTLKTRRYMCGLEQPNYPMPAIVYQVDIGSTFVSVQPKRWYRGLSAVYLKGQCPDYINY